MDQNVGYKVHDISRYKRMKNIFSPIKYLNYIVYLMEILPQKNIGTPRKFNSEYRRKLVTKLDKILGITKNKSDSFNVYNIINEDIGTNFSTNRNGIFINMNILSDDCIQKLVDFIDTKHQYSTLSESEKQHNISYKSVKLEEEDYISGMGNKLSN